MNGFAGDRATGSDEVLLLVLVAALHEVVPPGDAEADLTGRQTEREE